jgi:hypothetical protein
VRYYSITIGGLSSVASPGTTQGAASGNGSAPAASAPGAAWDPTGGLFDTLPAQGSNTPAGGNITVNKAGTPLPVPAQSSMSASGATFSSVVNGVNDPGALDIEFEVELAQNQQGVSNHIKIKGIPFSMISQATDLNNHSFELRAGYTNGLPLANLQVKNQGVILSGNILPCFGNWIYNELSLEMFVVPNLQSGGIGGPTNPKNIVHNMPANTPLSSAIQQTLSAAFPNSTINVNINSALKLSYPDWGAYQSLEQYANYIKALSHSILGTPDTTGYQGVVHTSNGNTINVNDGPNGGVTLIYEDLVGQPTWIAKDTIQIKTLLRGDIPTPNFTTIILPPGLTTIGYNKGMVDVGNPGPAGSRNFVNFSGSWQVNRVRHIGRFRNPSMDAWVTIIDAVAPTGAGTYAGSGPVEAAGG